MTLRPPQTAGSSDLAGPEISITGAATATIGRWHRCSGTAADYTLTLPPLAGNAGKQVGIVMAAGLTKLVTVDGDGAELIDGQATRIMWAGEVAILRVSDDESQWVKIAGKTRPMHGRITLAGNQQFSANAMTKVGLNTQDFANAPAGYVDIANNRFVIKRPGTYRMSTRVFWNSTNTSGTRVETQFAINGTQYLGNQTDSVLASSVIAQDASQMTGSAAAGATLDLYARYFAGNYTTSCFIAVWLAVEEVPTW